MSIKQHRLTHDNCYYVGQALGFYTGGFHGLRMGRDDGHNRIGVNSVSAFHVALDTIA